MHSDTIHQQDPERFHGAHLAAPRQRSISVRRRCAPRVQSGPGRWALVQVWDAAVLASFDDETSAREVMAGIDGDEVVVLCVGT